MKCIVWCQSIKRADTWYMTTCNIGNLQQVRACSINSFDFSVRKRPTLGISRAVLLELPRNRSEPVAFINSFDFRILAYKLQTLRDDCFPTQLIYYSFHFQHITCCFDYRTNFSMNYLCVEKFCFNTDYFQFLINCPSSKVG